MDSALFTPDTSATPLSSCVDPFLGNDTTDLPNPSGIARRWWCAKPPVGNTHPGATLPFGMLSVCSYSGAYVTGYGQNDVSLSGDDPIKLFDRHETLGLAHFQQSGTGRIRCYYNYLLTTPYYGEGVEGVGTRYGLVDEQASPGYYAGRFEESDIRFETTCSKRSAVHRYHFPKGQRGKVAINFASGGLLIEGMTTYPSHASITFLDDGKAEGQVTIEGITYYVKIETFSPVAEQGFWKKQKTLAEGNEDGDPKTYRLKPKATRKRQPFGIWFEAAEADQPFELRISFSLRSQSRARQAMERRRPLDFAQMHASAAEHWESVLGRIEIEGATEEEQEIFYSALYHSTIKPADFTDENPYRPQDGPFFFDLSTLWDLYKTQLPLVMTLWPEMGRDFTAFLLEVAKREGAFPISYLMDIAPERFAKQATGLCHMILNDAHMRGIEGDWEEILRMLWKTSLSGKGRGGKFSEYAKNHVVHPLSHTLDLAFANWCIAQLAKKLGDQVIYEKSIPLAKHWENAFDKDTGLLRTDSDYYEGENWNYSFRFLHDMTSRIKLAGGPQAFVQLLDYFFGFDDPQDGRELFRFEGLNNEPDMESPYAYIYAGRHDRTAEVVRNVMRYQFTTGKGGLPGNDDSGGLSSWYVWSAIGLFPVTAMPVMLIGSPLYEKSTIRLFGGDFTITAQNQGPENIYVQRAWLNGRPLERAYLKLDEFKPEAELTLEMGSTPTRWGSEDLPPSFIF